MAITYLSGKRVQGISNADPVARQGYDGGKSSDSSGGSPAGGGGGSSAIGGTASGYTVGGVGGAGTASTILDDSSDTYAGGGGGGTYNAGTGGAGGSGGAGAGGTYNATTVGGDATANTGSGGGGGSRIASGESNNAGGGDGGSGIVIIRFTSTDFSQTNGTTDTSSVSPETTVKWTTSGTFTPTGSFDIEYLVIAGGGGGGSGYAGGGGAGGFRTNYEGTALGVTAQEYTVTIGNGGAGGVASATNNGVKGDDSVFGSITSIGGGYGGEEASGGSGGSGGGAGWGSSNTGGAGTGATSTDEKTLVTDVPVGSQFEQTDNYKSYQMSKETVSGADLKAYWKFDDTGDPSVNDAGNVTDNVSLGTGADLDATGSPDYEETGTPTNLGNATKWNQVSATSGDYADAGTSVSQFNFMHSDTPKWTLCFWAKTSETSVSNTMLMSTNDGNTTRGFEIYFYGTGTVKLRVNMTDGSNPDGRPIQTQDFTALTADGNWHFYVMTCDMSQSTCLNYCIDDGSRETGTRHTTAVASGDAYSALKFRHNVNGSFFIQDTTQYCEMSIWDRILTDAEITTIYNSGDGLQLDTGLKVWVERGTAI